MSRAPTGANGTNAKLAVLGLITLFATSVSGYQVRKIINADFSKDDQGFKYSKDTFRKTKQPLYSKGHYGSYHKALVITLGGVDNDDIWDVSGGWGRDFQLSSESDIQVMFDLRMYLSSGIDEGDDLDAMIAIDGKTVGSEPRKDFVAQLRGENGNKKQDTGYRTITVNVGRLSKGKHSILIGGFLLTKDAPDEIARIFIRNVMLKSGRFAPLPPPISPTNAPSEFVTFEPTEGTETRSDTLMPTRSPTRPPTPSPTKSPTSSPTQAPIKLLGTKIFNADFKGTTSGFAFIKDLFGTNEPKYVSGRLVDNSRLSMWLGRTDNQDVRNMSGAWKRSFRIPRDARNVQVMFQYSVILTPSASGTCEARATFAGKVLESKPGSGAVSKLNGENRNTFIRTGTRTFSANVGQRKAGNYDVLLGGFLNRKQKNTEGCDVNYDNVMVLVDYAPTRSPTPSPTRPPTPVSSKILDAKFKDSTFGFSYIDDAFRNTHNPAYANGIHSKRRGTLGVWFGGKDNRKINNMSGAWKRSFHLPRNARNVRVMFSYVINLSADTSHGDSCQALVTVANKVVESTPHSGAVDTLHGNNEIRIGGFMNRKDSSRESCSIYYSDVMIFLDDEPALAPIEPPVIIYAKFDKTTDGFSYHDDTFGTRQPNYARGDHWKNNKGGKLAVILGGVDDRSIRGMSGGWNRDFNILRTGQYTIKFKYMLYNSGQEEKGDVGRLILRVNSDLKILATIDGRDDSTESVSTGWKWFNERFHLNAGTNRITLGASLGFKDAKNENLVAVFDNLVIRK